MKWCDVGKSVQHMAKYVNQRNAKYCFELAEVAVRLMKRNLSNFRGFA